MKGRYLVVLGLVAAGLTLPAGAQSSGGWAPVDQAVGDIDPLSRSLRQMQVGMRQDGEQTSLFQLTPWSWESGDWAEPVLPPVGVGLGRHEYLRVGPGFKARVDRMEYLIPRGRRRFKTNVTPRRDGVFLELTPANTVFDLGGSAWGLDGDTSEVQPQPPAPRLEYRLDLRINGRIDGRVDGSLQPIEGG